MTRLRPAVLDNPSASRDGLLLTPGERFQLFLIKTGVAFLPPLALALVAIAFGGYVVALVVVVIGGLAALTVGSSVRRLRAALAVGVVVAAGLLVVNLILAWLTTHPMLPAAEPGGPQHNPQVPQRYLRVTIRGVARSATEPEVRRSGRPPDRNLALELVRVTEAAGLAAARWIGRGRKESADQAAVDGMRGVLDSVAMRGVVVIGEGEKDEAPMLFNGEEVGDGSGPEVDVAVDPLEGTRLTALGQPNAIAVIAVAERGTMFFPGAAVYMEKIAAGPEAIGAVEITASPTQNVQRVAEALHKTPRDVHVVVLERDRHEELIDELRDAGARVHLIRDGDVAPSIAAAQPNTGVDLLYGIGGTPEGVISAAALKCVGGGIQARLWPRDDAERQKLLDAGLDPARVLTTNDLVRGDDVFVAATGVTSGALLRGVRYTPGGAITDSIVMRSRSGTVRRIEAQHSFEKLSQLSGLEYR